MPKPTSGPKRSIPGDQTAIWFPEEQPARPSQEPGQGAGLGRSHQSLPRQEKITRDGSSITP